MLKRLSRITLAFAMASSLAAGPLARPASASTGSTWTIITAAAALIGGIVLYNNYEHKKQAANTVVGYTRNGGTVYGDGRIVMPNGQTIYPNANGQYPWGQTAYYRPNATGYTYDVRRTGMYDRTHRHGYAARYDSDDRDDSDGTYRRASYRSAPVAHRYHARGRHGSHHHDRD